MTKVKFIFFSVYFDDQKISTADLKLGGIFRKFQNFVNRGVVYLYIKTYLDTK